MHHSASVQAYTEADYYALLNECGLGDVTIYPSWGENNETTNDMLMFILAQKKPLP
jgi:hypothetical protein